MSSVSIAMATFNGERYLPQQLASLAAQSHPPSELVVTDDGSTDATLSLVNDFAASAPFPVCVHRNETRLGYRANFLRAATLCTSDLIAFCDQDDVWDSRKIEICLPLFSNSDVLLAYHNAVKITADGHPIGLLDDWVLPQVINPPMSIGPWPFVKGFTQVFRRSLPYSHDLWEMSVDHADARERMAHDQWFFFFSSVLGSIAYINEPLAYYRLHSSNAVGILEHERLIGAVRLCFANFADKYAQFERAARASANILDKAKEYWSGTWYQRASMAAEKYRLLEHQYADRRILYTAVETSRRLKAFRSILLSGGYGRCDRYNFGLRSLAKDALLGVLMGRRLKRVPDTGRPFDS
jgi:glycosyltransferase involved in cell wall biosynthesis